MVSGGRLSIDGTARFVPGPLVQEVQLDADEYARQPADYHPGPRDLAVFTGVAPTYAGVECMICASTDDESPDGFIICVECQSVACTRCYHQYFGHHFGTRAGRARTYEARCVVLPANCVFSMGALVVPPQTDGPAGASAVAAAVALARLLRHLTERSAPNVPFGQASAMSALLPPSLLPDLVYSSLRGAAGVFRPLPGVIGATRTPGTFGAAVDALTTTTGVLVNGNYFLPYTAALRSLGRHLSVALRNLASAMPAGVWDSAPDTTRLSAAVVSALHGADDMFLRALAPSAAVSTASSSSSAMSPVWPKVGPAIELTMRALAASRRPAFPALQLALAIGVQYGGGVAETLFHSLAANTQLGNSATLFDTIVVARRSAVMTGSPSSSDNMVWLAAVCEGAGRTTATRGALILERVVAANNVVRYDYSAGGSGDTASQTSSTPTVDG